MAMLTPAQNPRGLARIIFMCFLLVALILPQGANFAKAEAGANANLDCAEGRACGQLEPMKHRLINRPSALEVLDHDSLQ